MPQYYVFKMSHFLLCDTPVLWHATVPLPLPPPLLLPLRLQLLAQQYFVARHAFWSFTAASWMRACIFFTCWPLPNLLCNCFMSPRMFWSLTSRAACI